MDFKKISNEIIAAILLINFLVSFEWSRNLIYSPETTRVIFQIGVLCVCLGLAIAGKTDWIEEIVALVLEVAIYWGIVWSPYPITSLIQMRLAPIAGAVAAVIIIVKNIINDGTGKGR